jgi:light-harvesting complex I chlorophyll a/b binding protein 3
MASSAAVASRATLQLSVAAARTSCAASSSFKGTALPAVPHFAGVARKSVVVKATADKPAKVERDTKGLFFPSKQSLAYLDGTLPGDKGFDPLGLLDPEGSGGFLNPEWLPYAEIINGRFAMLGAAGMIAPEILGRAGLIPQETAVVWFKSGVFPPAGGYNYWADAYTLFILELVLMGFAEHKRLSDYRKPGSQGKVFFLGMEKFLGGSGEPAYPGGPFFNFAGFGKDEKSRKDLRDKELENGRLAMLAVLGYFVQALSTGKGPYENLLDHLSSPTTNNILTTWGTPPGL